MKKIFFLFFLIAGISIAAVNLTNAQEIKAKVSCCAKAKANATATATEQLSNERQSNRFESIKCKLSQGLSYGGEKELSHGRNQNCPKAGTKDCPNPNCPLKAGAVANKKPQAKTGPVAEAKLK